MTLGTVSDSFKDPAWLYGIVTFWVRQAVLQESKGGEGRGCRQNRGPSDYTDWELACSFYDLCTYFNRCLRMGTGQGNFAAHGPELDEILTATLRYTMPTRQIKATSATPVYSREF
ncbi:hypothetical protein MCOR02_011837 [Pyricularia oryzae]|uniref:Uncharacterized protein n=1 Tax=Pyricularia grisea TaxID=148305 RepID=A0ABQ8NA68_PYRGI|nr:hypothetical protein MCOR01_005224 [Pyricularia oryzae]KAI6293769.1 hypothetical protein MCOR33_008893 [Pyricularia grisea]KAH9427599.1 hypothetical protein MCOR02_011837 [Pyricularia oryzae]KAI6267348.1 hypothetical protein MCOR26_009735 [Pyricularia oryzae]KAI6307959.1 hypothetical protein MCOR29_009480 [Pyricularia oryzae]